MAENVGTDRQTDRQTDGRNDSPRCACASIVRLVRDAMVLLRTKSEVNRKRRALSPSWNAFAVVRASLGSGLSLAAFDRLRGTRVVASRLPRTRNPKRTVLPAVVETSVATF